MKDPLSGRELATVLAALRYYQQDWQREIREADAEGRDPIPVIADGAHFAEHAPLSPEEIDALCERLNVPAAGPARSLEEDDLAHAIIEHVHGAFCNGWDTVHRNDEIAGVPVEAEDMPLAEACDRYMALRTADDAPDEIDAMEAADVNGEHPKYSRADWEHEVGESDTNLGYWDWCRHQRDADEPDDEEVAQLTAVLERHIPDAMAPRDPAPPASAG